MTVPNPPPERRACFQDIFENTESQDFDAFILVEKYYQAHRQLDGQPEFDQPCVVDGQLQGSMAVDRELCDQLVDDSTQAGANPQTPGISIIVVWPGPSRPEGRLFGYFVFFVIFLVSFPYLGGSGLRPALCVFR